MAITYIRGGEQKNQILFFEGKRNSLPPCVAFNLSPNHQRSLGGWDFSWRASCATERWKREVGYDTATIKPPEKLDFGLRMFHFFTLRNSYQEPYKVMAGLDIRLFALPVKMFFLLYRNFGNVFQLVFACKQQLSVFYSQTTVKNGWNTSIRCSRCRSMLQSNLSERRVAYRNYKRKKETLFQIFHILFPFPFKNKQKPNRIANKEPTKLLGTDATTQFSNTFQCSFTVVHFCFCSLPTHLPSQLQRLQVDRADGISYTLLPSPPNPAKLCHYYVAIVFLKSVFHKQVSD